MKHITLAVLALLLTGATPALAAQPAQVTEADVEVCAYIFANDKALRKADLKPDRMEPVDEAAVNDWLVANVQRAGWCALTLATYREANAPEAPTVDEALDALVPDGSVTFSGRNSMTTAPFVLDGGEYTVDLVVTNERDSIYDCVSDGLVSVRLKRTDGERVSGGSFDQSGYAYGLEAGRYYLDVNTVDWCGWEVTISPML